MSLIDISYILTTYQKCQYLQVTLPYVLEQLLPNEELILVDGNSKDGTVPFIEKSVQGKSNITFVSEPDRGESDGLNKALNLCRGRVIKNLTDDDAFSFNAIRKAAVFLENSEADIMGFDGFGLSLHEDSYHFNKTKFSHDFFEFQKNKQPFFFCGLSYLIKRSSLPALGLFSIEYKMVDLEYSFRISASGCKIAWSNLSLFVNIYNADSNTLRLNKTLEKESLYLHKKYRSFSHYLNIFLRFKLQRALELKNKFAGKAAFGMHNKLEFKEAFYKAHEVLEAENTKLKEPIFYS